MHINAICNTSRPRPAPRQPPHPPRPRPAPRQPLEFTWGTDLLRIELHQDGAGTLLTLTDTFDDVGKAARDAAGWHECLDRLVGDLDGLTQPPWGERWRQIHPAYVSNLGPEASTIGPPADPEQYTSDPEQYTSDRT